MAELYVGPVAYTGPIVPLETTEDVSVTPKIYTGPVITPEDAIASLPETLPFAGLDTGIKVDPRTMASIVGAGRGIGNTIRGVKQWLGITPQEELTANEQTFKALQASNVGGYATVGELFGNVMDPAVLALPAAKAKTIAQSIKYGAVAGGVLGGVSEVGEGQTRIGNMGFGVGAGSAGGVILGGLAEGTRRVASRFAPKVAAPMSAEFAAPAKTEAQRIISEYTTPPQYRAAEVAAAQTPEVAKAVAPVVTKELSPLAPSLQVFKTEVAPEYTKRVTSLAEEFFKANPEKRDLKVLISDDVKKYVWTGDIKPDFLAQYGLDPHAFATELRATASDAGRTLQAYSQIVQKYISPEMAEALKKLGVDIPESIVGRPLWRRMTDLWRASLVTQLATGVRNAVTQVGRLGIDAMTDAMDAGVQRALGMKNPKNPLDGFEVLLQLGRSNKDAVEKILSNQPSIRDRLFSNYLSDVPIPKDAGISGVLEKTLRTAESGVNVLNIFNRTQEFLIRRAVFQARLAQDIRAQGGNLVEMIKSGGTTDIPVESIKKAANAALYATFAESPAQGTVAKAVVDFVNRVPGLSIAIPFPRFLMNAIKFQYQHSPAGILSYLSEAERKVFAAGDTSRMSKAILGSGLFGAAMAFRNSEIAGEKWYEAVKETGEVVDLRPYNPFSSYLFIADLLKKRKEGTLYKITPDDVAQGVISTGLRAGTGLYILDNALNIWAGQTGDEEKFKEKVKQFAGELASGFATPLAQLRDVYDEFTQGYANVKDTRQEPFAGPIKRQIPGLSQTLPDQVYPTREGPKMNVDPLFRQLTGLGISGPKNALEKEIDRLGFDARSVLASTGDPQVDRQYREVMGKLLGPIGSAVVQTPSYKAMKDSVKGVVLDELMKAIKEEVHTGVNASLPPDKQVKRAIHELSPRIRILLREAGLEKE